MFSTPLWKALFLAVLALTALACITINVYFPEAAVKDLSEKIEEAVVLEAAKHEAGEETGAENEADSTGETASEGQEWASLSAEHAIGDAPSLVRRTVGTVLGALVWLTAAPIDAQEVAAPEISNPAIRQIIASRGQRAGQIDDFKSQGVLGENKDALIEVRELGSLALQQRAAVQKLVRDENADRERMFREIAAATNVDLAQLPRIRETYAETLRQNAASGHWIQKADGQWVRK